jgi:hypothetical protein
MMKHLFAAGVFVSRFELAAPNFTAVGRARLHVAPAGKMTRVGISDSEIRPLFFGQVAASDWVSGMAYSEGGLWLSPLLLLSSDTCLLCAPSAYRTWTR